MENLMEQNLYRVANKGRKFHFQIRYNVLRLLYAACLDTEAKTSMMIPGKASFPSVWRKQYS
jgi:hypothetical protein